MTTGDTVLADMKNELRHVTVGNKFHLNGAPQLRFSRHVSVSQ